MKDNPLYLLLDVLFIKIVSQNTMSSYYTGTNHDMYRLQGPFPPRPRHNTGSQPSISEDCVKSQSHKREIPSSSQTIFKASSRNSSVPAESIEGHTLRPKRSWSWCASSDFTQFPPFEQAHHRRSADKIRDRHGDHGHTQAVWSPYGGTPEGMTPLPTPLEGGDSTRSVFDSEESGEGTTEQASNHWWTRVWKGATGWLGEKRG